MTKKLWVICLATWLILYGLLAVTNFQFELSHVIMGLLAIVSGIFLVIDK